MCGHQWKKYNDVWYCTKCGIIRLPNNKIIFDRKLVNYTKKVKHEDK